MSGPTFWENFDRAKDRLVAAKIDYARNFLLIKMRRPTPTDGMAHQMTIEETHGELADAEADFDIFKARAYTYKEDF